MVVISSHQIAVTEVERLLMHRIFNGRRTERSQIVGCIDDKVVDFGCRRCVCEGEKGNYQEKRKEISHGGLAFHMCAQSSYGRENARM